LNIENLEKWARVKGLGLLGTSDFCHPEWQLELKRELKEKEAGIFRSKSGFPFILTNEISLMYSQGRKGRRVHLILWAPSFSAVDKITDYLKKHGRVDYDGRPIFKISCIDFTREMKSISEDIEIIPAHAWTPWFGVFGSKTGFDTLQEAFGDQVKHIHAIESGLSSNPEMNRRLSKLDNVRIVSFSDSHSFWPWRIGREATIFELEELSYSNIIRAVRTGKGLVGTIEVDPGYGIYHFDGHRACNFSASPEESKKLNKICPICKRPLTIGVGFRVDELADRSESEGMKRKDFSYKIIPLHEIISVSLGTGLATKKTWSEYYNILKAGKDELDILLNVSEAELLKVTSPKIANLILKNRRGELVVKPGYDGVYGKLILDGREVSTEEDSQEEKEESSKPRPQSGLNDYF
jgi:uncharacterized protein (TIGR00375 family)